MEKRSTAPAVISSDDRNHVRTFGDVRRRRIEMFKQSKAAEGESGKSLYGMTTWEKLEEIMTTIESNLFNQILEKNPDLAERYTSSSQLTELIEERIHEKILNS